MAGRLALDFGSPEDLPIAGPMDLRKKLARIAASWAILDCSTNDEFKTIIVKPEYAIATNDFLRSIYSDSDSMLSEYSRHCSRVTDINDFSAIRKSISDYIAKEDKIGRPSLSFLDFLRMLIVQDNIQLSFANQYYGTKKVEAYIKVLMLLRIGFIEDGEICKNIRLNLFVDRLRKDDNALYTRLMVPKKEAEK
jgi:AAA15 family ATPase/GTPase